MKIIKKLTLMASLLLATISATCAAPVEDQAKLLYTALKGNQSTEAIYTYCTNHNISAEQITDETKKICEANNDWDTYSKATELAIAWEDRMHSISTPVKIIAALGVVATGACIWLLYRYLKKPAVETPPVVKPTPPVVDAAPPVGLPHPMPNPNNGGARPIPSPDDTIVAPMMADDAQPQRDLNPQALRAALEGDPRAQHILGNPRAMQKFQEILNNTPQAEGVLNIPGLEGIFGENGLLQNITTNGNLENLVNNPALGIETFGANFEETNVDGVRTQTRTEETNNNGVRTRKTTTVKTYRYP